MALANGFIDETHRNQQDVKPVLRNIPINLREFAMLVICSRCQFKVVSKNRICQVCGSKDVYEASLAKGPSIGDQARVSYKLAHAELGKRISDLIESFSSEFSECVEKCKSAYKKLVALATNKPLSTSCAQYAAQHNALKQARLIETVPEAAAVTSGSLTADHEAWAEPEPKARRKRGGILAKRRLAELRSWYHDYNEAA